MKISEIANRLNAKLLLGAGQTGDEEISRVLPIDEAKRSDVTFVANPRYQSYLQDSQAGAVILSKVSEGVKGAQLIVDNPYLAFAKVLGLFNPPKQFAPGVSQQAVVCESADIAADATVMPAAYISEGAKIGPRTVVMPGVFVGAEAAIGEDVTLHPNVVIGDRCVVGHRVTIFGAAVIGADGFGYANDRGKVVKVPQTGIVRIMDDVEIGACSSIDRAVLGETIIRDNVKLDSQVHIGHNADIGEQCVFSANTSIAGSAKIGRGVATGGLSGVAGHLTVGEGVQIGAMTGVIKDVGPGEVCLGFPAQPAKSWRRQQALMKQLESLKARIKDLESKVNP